MGALIRKICANKVSRRIYYTILIVIGLAIVYVLLRFLLGTFIVTPIINWWGSLGAGGKFIAGWLGISLLVGIYHWFF